MASFAENLKRIRKSAGLTAAELSARMQRSARFVGPYENGSRRPGLALIEEFAKALGVEPAKLCGWAVNKRRRR